MEAVRKLVDMAQTYVYTYMHAMLGLRAKLIVTMGTHTQRMKNFYNVNMYSISKGSMSMFGYIILPVTLGYLKDFVARGKSKYLNT